MKLISLFTVAFLFNTLFTDAQTLLPGAKLLFKGIKTKLSVADKNDIFLKTGYYYSSPQKILWPSKEAGTGDTALFKEKVLPTDMNNDGVEEIFIIAHIMSDDGVDFYIKKNRSYLKSSIMYENHIPDVLQSKNLGYNDVDAGESKYRFDGTGYKIFKGQTGATVKRIDAYSHDYTDK